MKTFTQSATDAGTIVHDSAAATITLLKSWLNECIHKVLAMRDWTFLRTYQDTTTVASQQAYTNPHNCRKIDEVFVYVGSTWYAPQEIKTAEEWRILNRVSVSGDVPQYWFQNELTSETEIYPKPSSAGNTIRRNYTKKIGDRAASSNTTGTITTTANSSVITGLGTAFTAAMVGRHIKITSSTTVLDGIWFEIETYTSATSITVKENIPVAVSGASFTIDEMMPLPDGFEDIPLYYAIAHYYRYRRRLDLAREYEELYKRDLIDLVNSDSKTANDLIKKQTPITPINPNTDPFAIGTLG